jgi:gas vesicle protein
MIGAAPMMDDRHYEATYGFAAGLMTGMVLGGVLALLFAPKAGSELRSELNDGMSTMRDQFGRRYRDFADKASAGVEQVKTKAQGMAADAKDFVQSKMPSQPPEQPTQH